MPQSTDCDTREVSCFQPARSGSGRGDESVAENSYCGNSDDDNSIFDRFNGQQLGIVPYLFEPDIDPAEIEAERELQQIDMAAD